MNDHDKLLLSVARVFRAQLREQLAGRPRDSFHLRADLDCLNQALAPYDIEPLDVFKNAQPKPLDPRHKADPNQPRFDETPIKRGDLSTSPNLQRMLDSGEARIEQGDGEVSVVRGNKLGAWGQEIEPAEAESAIVREVREGMALDELRKPRELNPKAQHVIMGGSREFFETWGRGPKLLISYPDGMRCQCGAVVEYRGQAAGNDLFECAACGTRGSRLSDRMTGAEAAKRWPHFVKLENAPEFDVTYSAGDDPVPKTERKSWLRRLLGEA